MRNLLLRFLALKLNPPTSTSASVFFSTSKLSPPPQSSFSAGAVADHATADDDDLHIPPVNVVKPAVLPTLLQPRVVVFDGVCRLCHNELHYRKGRGEARILELGRLRPKLYTSSDQNYMTCVKLIIRADKYEKIKFCCLQSKTAEPYMELCGVERKDVLRRFIFVEGLGQYHQASTAALKVMSYLPFPYSALSSLLVIPTPVRDAVYDYIAKRRYDWCGKEKECLVLKEPELLERFIDREELLEQRHSDV